MMLLLRTWAILVVATKRLLSHRWLALATGLGLIASVALTVSIPLYADAIYYRILHKELSGDPSGTRPPLKLLFRYVGGWNTSVEWEEGPLWVGNLAHFFEQAGGLFPYDVLLKTDPSVDYSQVLSGVRDMEFRVLAWNATSQEISEIQQRPERQGLFGVLSVGFVAAALLTVLGFLLYAFFSFRRRFIELGVLRAVGLSSGQMTVFLAWELAFLILTGLVAGTGLGVWASDLFIPYLQVGSQTPPFVVEIAWLAMLRFYALFGLLFVAALAGLAFLLMRMRIFQAVKLGETQ